jgi:chromate reductase
MIEAEDISSAKPLLHVLGLTGSLRSRSVNRALMNAASELQPADMQISLYSGLNELPHFNEDLEAEGDPDQVTALKNALCAADALLIVTPEYNSGIPGVLKNAIDWASRGTSPLKNLPVALMSASPSPMGGLRAQLQLRQTLTGIGAHVLPAPDVLVGSADQWLDKNLSVVHHPTRTLIASHLARLATWARVLGSSRKAADPGELSLTPKSEPSKSAA